MMIFLGMAFLIPVGIGTYLLNRKLNDKFHPTAIIVYTWSVLLMLAILLGDAAGMYPINESGILIFSSFLLLLVIFSYLLAPKGSARDFQVIDVKKVPDLFLICVILFALCVFSRMLYFRDLSRIVPLNSLFANSWRWKNAVVTGKFDEESLRYFGYNLNATGTLISLCYYQQKAFGHRWRKRFTLLMMLAYIALAFINVRRDPMIIKLIYVLCPVVVYNRHNFKKLLRFVVPLAIVFLVLLIEINTQLSFNNLDLNRSLASYSFGAFNSLQKAYDVGYASNTEFPLANTFYFVYMILKYIFPQMTPPGIILENLGPDTTNVYTALIAPLIDSGGSHLMFWIYLLIDALYIAVVNMLAYRWRKKSGSVASFLMYCTVFSCSIRAFYNPVYGYSDLIFGLFYALLIGFILSNQWKRGTQK